MKWGIMNYLLIHFMWGITLACVVHFVFFRNRKWRPFRFGGESPFSLGQKNKWLVWFGAAFVLEQITSMWFGDKIYYELAMSGIEAIAFTVGLFLVDRVAMMLEPEELWMPKPTLPVNVDVMPTLSEPAASKAENKEQSNLKTKTWAEEKIEKTARELNAAAGNVKDKANEAISGIDSETKEKVSEVAAGISNGISGYFAARRAKAEALQKSKEDETKKRIDRFRDLTKKF